MFTWLKHILGPVIFDDDSDVLMERFAPLSEKKLTTLDHSEGNGISLQAFMQSHAIDAEAVVKRAEQAPLLFQRAPQTYHAPLRFYMHAISLALEAKYPDNQGFILACAQRASAHPLKGRRRQDFMEQMVIALEPMVITQTINETIRAEYIQHINNISTYPQHYNAMFLDGLLRWQGQER